MGNPYVIGIDFGNTLTYRLSGHDESNRQLFPDALEIVQWMAQQWPVHIISKVNDRQRADVLNWLGKNSFLAKAGIPFENLHFCAERTEKFAICQKVGVTHHIDDRPEVFTNFDSKTRGLLFRPVPEDVVKFYNDLKQRNIVVVQSWQDIEVQLADYTNFPFA